jgi:CheY-like chemotaxis protein
MTILVVDDEPVSLEMLRQLIARIPECRTEAFTEPAPALAWCKANDPDLVIVDYVMPDVNGIEFTKRFREFPGKEEIPVLMVTAQDDQGVRKSALQNGVNDFLGKPYDFAELRVRVSNMLALRASQRQRASKASLLRMPPASRKQANSSLLNVDVTLMRLGGHQSALTEIARIFVFTVPHLLSAMRAALAHNDFERVLAQASSLKGAVAAVEAPQVFEFVVNVENHARKYDGPSAMATLTMAETLVERLLTELKQFVPEYAEPAAKRRG